MTKRHEATAIAHPNIALAKYWGKQAAKERLPAVPSLSVTLEGMATRTTVAFDEAVDADALVVNGANADATRATALLDRVRALAGTTLRARVTSENDFPTASGLASSASAFAALAVAASAAAGLSLSLEALSDLARKSSVSAARSVFGGFVELPLATTTDALSARQVASEAHWDLRVVVAVTREGAKETSSTDGMRRTEESSPYYAAWVAHAPSLFSRVARAVLERDLEKLGRAAEASALAMHAVALASEPPLLYWNGATVEALRTLESLRARGVQAFPTIDAGPHVKAITSAEHEAEVTRALAATPGVLRTIATRPGGGARLVLAVS